MTEESTTLKEFIKIPSRLITRKAPILVPDNLAVGEDNISIVIDDVAASEYSRKFLVAEKVEPPQRLATATTYAKRFVNGLRQNIGLPSIDEGEMEVVYLPDDKFKKFYRQITGLPEDAPIYSSGITFRPAGVTPVVSLVKLPDYLLAGNSCHELIHQWLEKYVGVYSVETPTSNYIYFESRRAGLSTKGKGAMKGIVLNELPNYYYEGIFIREMLTAHSEEFQDEIAERQRYLERYPVLSELSEYNSAVFKVIEPGSEGRRIILDKEFIHFDKDGNIFGNSFSGYAYMQLAKEINKLCGNVDGKQFMELMIKAKTDPHILPKIRHIMNLRIGEGFFEKLRNANYSGEGDDVVGLLMLIQQESS